MPALKKCLPPPRFHPPPPPPPYHKKGLVRVLAARPMLAAFWCGGVFTGAGCTAPTGDTYLVDLSALCTNIRSLRLLLSAAPAMPHRPVGATNQIKHSKRRLHARPRHVGGGYAG